jgi:hypothetical protein
MNTLSQQNLANEYSTLVSLVKEHIEEHYAIEELITISQQARESIKSSSTINQKVESAPLQPIQKPPTHKLPPSVPSQSTNKRTPMGPAESSTELQQVVTHLKQLFPKLSWHPSPPPSPFTASESLTLAPVMIFSTATHSKERSFLFSLAKAIEISFCPTSVYSATTLSKEELQKIEGNTHVRLLIFTPEVKNQQNSKRSLQLKPIAEYFSSPQHKADLWGTLCKTLK